MLIFYKNASRANFYVDAVVECVGGFTASTETGPDFLVPFGEDSNTAQKCTLKLRSCDIDGVTIGQEIFGPDIFIRTDRGELNWKNAGVFLLPTTKKSIVIQLATKERSPTIKEPFCLCFSSNGIIVARSESILILSKPPNVHRMPFARIVQGKTTGLSPSRWIAGFSAETHTYTPLSPSVEVKVWKRMATEPCFDIAEENERLKKRMRVLETERDGFLAALTLLKPFQ